MIGSFPNGQFRRRQLHGAVAGPLRQRHRNKRRHARPTNPVGPQQHSAAGRRLNQRLTCGFLRALIARAAKSGNCKLLTAMANVHANDLTMVNHKFSIIELANFVDLTPGTDPDANRLDFNSARRAAASQADHSRRHGGFPPMLDLSYEELGSKLVNFARSRNIAMEFRVILSSSSNAFSSLIEQLRLQQLTRAENGEALVINCHMMLHYIPEEPLPTIPTSFENSTTSLRSMFLKALRSLNPTIVVLVDEDADFTSNNLVNRLRSAYNYLWIPYDTVDTLLPRGSKQRQWYEADICWKIENVISQEGHQRVERLETRSKWVQRMRNASFRGVGFSEDAITEVKNMLDEHAAGWGVKKEEEDIVLTWKGHNVVFATAWTPL
ncbi:hypothetical protein DH2020_016095 [Rehmannia glutinosa]|uniref:Scarecrow-like protein 32 n=1 Tax=Rehmannia glutinosa TaxID=99300 RepID=A0ABR0WUI8_REHGL